MKEIIKIKKVRGRGEREENASHPSPPLRGCHRFRTAEPIEQQELLQGTDLTSNDCTFFPRGVTHVSGTIPQKKRN